LLYTCMTISERVFFCLINALLNSCSEMKLRVIRTLQMIPSEMLAKLFDEY
jgi:hypothetical protein